MENLNKEYANCAFDIELVYGNCTSYTLTDYVSNLKSELNSIRSREEQIKEILFELEYDSNILNKEFLQKSINKAPYIPDICEFCGGCGITPVYDTDNFEHCRRCDTVFPNTQTLIDWCYR